MRRFSLFLYATLFGFSACSPRGPQTTAPPPTGAATFGRSWESSKLGYVFISSYFRAGQVDEPAWEAFRLKKMTQVRICKTGERILHRDVRWFPKTRIAKERCAAIIYTVMCDIPTNATQDTLESDRQDALLRDMQEAPAKNCS